MAAPPSPESPVPSPVFSSADHALMARALRLAARGLYTTQPNPRVGCVIARDGATVGEGWHRRAGEPHAEVFALRAAADAARGATVYTTLEPCSHHGRTPPCADALIEAGVARVVFASEDPNPRVSGMGIQRMRDGGIAIEHGLMRDPARELNRGFFSRFERRRPWVRVKLATSLDGRTALANGESKWITGEAARADVQRWRARSSAILTGAGTARSDDPRLTVRLRSLSPDGFVVGGEGWGEGAGRDGAARLEGSEPSDEASPALRAAKPFDTLQLDPLASATRSACGRLSPPEADGGEGFKPLRVLLDARLDALQRDAHLLDGSAPTLVLHAPDAQPKDDRYARVELVALPIDGSGRLDLEAAMQLLAARGVNELQVEAGPGLCGALLERRLVDELLLYVAPILLGDRARPLFALPALDAMAARWQLRAIEHRRVGEDWRLLLRPDRSGNEGSRRQGSPATV
ncbi:MAG TPA: bifunctional diaminohydroxyphosphoribosylaminopyrimidine deaminase/5-amino-6-(5-phosphoribosylamino)uracil reductase RibD [Rhodanobacteraceae bacterium]|nr:bifunctional diaminohydroxyphosphoribosylaminopyrimidine deaminase/5-amino-6-(5-phosphoribosylamino)uracil reductase RibD [Rhodanobacteraceae bacterium]